MLLALGEWRTISVEVEVRRSEGKKNYILDHCVSKESINILYEATGHDNQQLFCISLYNLMRKTIIEMYKRHQRCCDNFNLISV
jgi:hypothetical protein